MMSRNIGPGRLSRVSAGAGLPSTSDRVAQRVQDRLAKIAQLRSQKPAAKSAAHEGVVERPMDKQISKILQMKREQSRQSGTSVYRIRENEDLKSSSVARTQSPINDLPLVRLPQGIVKPKPKI
ncbi:hypothetical protein A3E39_01505 [Candidatus Uhrbacteria bacterium RIFCSPHIGHO2_12_FULL_60_25]|uniref:Uncharacterized protein n=1 Tax=Candidatus Uhrbacteria bacterium RIFCSPHIGHO2_12_FULL_60_25 TaxID=1802399 RepID=A0A1F7UJR1_9BACT|nr:MAG: hypothetical protein A3D73_04105 [Candidatus Uhrbacteria bacterium RIFCSPHIGHO2_02_FULL_60_44]OGL78516.1 MAG: hypothetical protein A3E39_01505 [Candidatus Uhrbacteria bacterium RIFCSPHIGHO2_12_FULL_60_25]